MVVFDLSDDDSDHPGPRSVKLARKLKVDIVDISCAQEEEEEGVLATVDANVVEKGESQAKVL